MGSASDRVSQWVRSVTPLTTSIASVSLEPTTSRPEPEPKNRYEDISQAYQSRRYHSERILVASGERFYSGWTQSAKHIGQHMIPTDLLRQLEDKREVNRCRPELSQSLSTTNYINRFHTLLWIEEFANRECLKRFFMTGVQLVPNGRFLTMTVPGLADNRPSLILGDSILVTNPDQYSPHKKPFEGFIHEVCISGQQLFGSTAVTTREPIAV